MNSCCLFLNGAALGCLFPNATLPGCLFLNATLGCLFLNAMPRAASTLHAVVQTNKQNNQMTVRRQPAGNHH
jgi:hypothetical protein